MGMKGTGRMERGVGKGKGGEGLVWKFLNKLTAMLLYMMSLFSVNIM